MTDLPKHAHIAEPYGPELENLDPQTARVFHAMGRVMHLHRLATGKMLSEHGVQHAEAFALPLLVMREGISQRELGDVLHLSPPRISMVLRELESSGLVVRRPDESDRRVTRVFLTPMGRRREGEQRALLRNYVDRTLGALSEVDQLELERLLRELADRTMEVLQDVPEGEDKAAR